MKATDLKPTEDDVNLAPAPRPAHSPLGASGAERWMNCAGSVALIEALKLAEANQPPVDDPSWTKEGTAMHEAAADCLVTGKDTWEITGQVYAGVEITADMAKAVQVYLDHVRLDIDQAVVHYVEFGISSPVHKNFYGTLDFGAIFPTKIKVKDFKGGEGIVVEVEDNPQIKYYAFGLIDGLEAQTGKKFPDDLEVELGICQPRAYHHDGEATHLWSTTVGEIKEWVHSVLVPAMCRTEYDNHLDAGEWCRFCPAKLVCPLLTSLFRAAATHNPAEVIHLSNDMLGRSYALGKGVKMYLNALEAAAMTRLSRGETVTGTKLVPKKANRVYVVNADVKAKALFGADAMNPASMKSPAELEKISSAAATWVKEHAYTPVTGNTVALESDPRPAVVIKPTTEAFKVGLASLGLGTDQ